MMASASWQANRMVSGCAGCRNAFRRSAAILRLKLAAVAAPACVSSFRCRRGRVPRRNPPSTHHPQGRHLPRIQMLPDRAGDETRRDRRAVVMQDRYDPHRVDATLVYDQRAQLRVAVLLDQEHELMLGDEIGHVLVEGKG